MLAILQCAGIFPLDYEMLEPKLSHQNLAAAVDDLVRTAEAVAIQDEDAEQRHLKMTGPGADVAGPATPPSGPETLPGLHQR